jgi:hypothetical protein
LPRTSPKPPGRPPRVVFNEENRRIYCALLEHGFTKGKAARLIGVASRTIQEAVQADPVLAERARLAVLEFHAKSTVRVARAGKYNWRASAWLLERASPRRGPGRPRMRSQLQTDPLFRRDMKALVREVLLEVMPNLRPPPAATNGHIAASKTDYNHPAPSELLRRRGDLVTSEQLENAQTKARQPRIDIAHVAAQLPTAKRLPAPAANASAPISAQNP